MDFNYSGELGRKTFQKRDMERVLGLRDDVLNELRLIFPPGIQANAVLNVLRCANNNHEHVEMGRGSLRQLAYISTQSNHQL